jgi:hypothetical protein
MMANLTLKGTLNLLGKLDLNPDGGKVLIGDAGLEALVENAEGQAPPVILPPPPAAPSDPGPTVKVISSFNKTVTAGGKNLVALGIVMQGNIPSWPGMMLPSAGNTGPVTINGIPINVQQDQATIFPSGGVASFAQSGQA